MFNRFFCNSVRNRKCPGNNFQRNYPKRNNLFKCPNLLKQSSIKKFIYQQTSKHRFIDNEKQFLHIHSYLRCAAFKKDEGWTYSTDGHTMCISGYRNDLAYFMVGDPYIKWVNPNASMVYDKPASVIHKAISQRGNGYIY